MSYLFSLEWIYTLVVMQSDFQSNQKEGIVMKDENMKVMLELIEQITDAIPKQHQSQIFWSPKTNSDDGRVAGYRLYAYGGYVLRIFEEKDELVYETNYHVYKDNYFEDLWDDTKFQNSKVHKKSKDVKTLPEITNLWEPILEAYKKRMYGKGKIKKEYLERGRATAIARKIELESDAKDFYFIEQESRIKVSKKKPDLIGIHNENGKTMISFIEYKCTTSGMNGVTLTEHFEDMSGFYQNINMDAGYKTLYEQMLDFADFKYQQQKNVFKVNSIEDGEIVFLFSNIGTKDGISAQKIYNDVCRLIYECKDYPRNKERVKFLILKNEEELFSPRDYMSAETLLKHVAFVNCDKEEWKKRTK